MNDIHPNVLQAAQFEKWTRAEGERVAAAHEVEPGHVSYQDDEPAGRKAAQLRSARDMLMDFGSLDAYSKMDGREHTPMLEQPLRELLPERYHPLVDEHERAQADARPPRPRR